jgi:transcriptional regulator with XRE-family HTH domain
MSDNKRFGVYLEGLRLHSGYTAQIDLAKVSGVSKSTISRVESGEVAAKPETLKKLAPFLKVSFEELMREAGYMDEPTIIAYGFENAIPNWDKISPEGRAQILKYAEFIKNGEAEKIK